MNIANLNQPNRFFGVWSEERFFFVLLKREMSWEDDPQALFIISFYINTNSTPMPYNITLTSPFSYFRIVSHPKLSELRTQTQPSNNNDLSKLTLQLSWSIRIHIHSFHSFISLNPRRSHNINIKAPSAPMHSFSLQLPVYVFGFCPKPGPEEPYTTLFLNLWKWSRSIHTI